MQTWDTTVTLGHSPDPDDAFMFYGLAEHKIATQGIRFEHVLQDIQTLNERAGRSELDITALSAHAYAHVRDRYLLLRSGASMGDGYGPMVIAREDIPLSALQETVIAIPGALTSAALGLKMRLGDTPVAVVPFDEIIPAVCRGDYQAGLIIHEGQLTYGQAGLKCLIDLGQWWKDLTGLPMPLGVNAVRKDMDPALQHALDRILSESIAYSLTHRAEAVHHALTWARDMGADLADRFIGMYVNDLTVDMGETGREALRRFFAMATEKGYLPEAPELEFLN